MNTNNKGATVYVPPVEDAVSTRHIRQTPEDRKQQISEHREERNHKARLKAERFKKILDKRKGGGGGSGGGINVKISSDK